MFERTTRATSNLQNEFAFSTAKRAGTQSAFLPGVGRRVSEKVSSYKTELYHERQREKGENGRKRYTYVKIR